MVEQDRETAARLVQRDYPFSKFTRAKRAYTAIESTHVFVKDGFIDRYSGRRLVFPGTLRLLSVLLPEEFPFHRNWKMDLTHPAFWELFPTIDHVVPVARGGEDAKENWVTTSQLLNSAKSSWTLEELSWKLVPPGSVEDWDGLSHWFIEFMEQRDDLLQNNYLRIWFRAAKACF